MKEETKEKNELFPSRPASAVELVDKLLGHAVSLGASDIHYDPRDGDVLVRLRIDGVMEFGGILDQTFHEETIARLKILSGARTDVHAVPQDGRWRTDIGGRPFNIRISFMPTYHGENAVIRLLPGRSDESMSFSRLGFTPDHVRMFREALTHTHGLILVTGPTGSGKTTTLQTFLREKAGEPLSIITLEDPVEYEIDGVRQIHIRHSHGVTFASGLRAALRQDPDVIMVGEVRDNDTARVAIHTALTGHLVLSTLHTNSALEAVTRLVDMGIDRYLLASTLRLIIAQRLVRCICRDCRGEGCAHCRESGYRGRSVIAEAIEIDSIMKKLIAGGASASDIADHAHSCGFAPIGQDGVEKVEWGVTSREEVLRVLQAE